MDKLAASVVLGMLAICAVCIYFIVRADQACTNSGGTMTVVGYQTVVTFMNVNGVVIPQTNVIPLWECKHNGAK